MKKRTIAACLTGVLLVALAGCASGGQGAGAQKGNETQMESENVQEAVKTEEVTNEKPLYQGASGKIERAISHDPSIVKEPETGMYYVFGTHLTVAKSKDLVNWEQVSSEYETVDHNPVYGNLEENLAESFRWAGSHDADCANGYAVWAPDVYWDNYYIWEDGSRGAYLLYYCTSSTYMRSCIGLAVSKTIEGPYEYKDTLIYSGFTLENGTDANSEIDTKWDNEYLNLSSLVSKGSANGGIDEINEKWFQADGSYNNKYAPNAIDPAIIDGADGNVYMVYGSWSGGLFLLEVEPETGLVKYPGMDGTEEKSGNYIDRYFGTHIAGGNHISGEGPFIVYDKAAGYYYLYETYGGLTANGGYNMRLFRSKDIYGPYVDAAGNQASDSGKGDNSKYGIKLIGNYQFHGQQGYKSAGHNSALIDGDGSRYLIFHQRFNLGSEYHEVRVRQQFLNEEGWPCVAVYENRNEPIANYRKKEVAGTYEYINHGKESSTGMLETGELRLEKNGKVSGAFEGAWEKKDSGNGYDYVTIMMDSGLVYHGIFFRQTNDLGEQVMTFTAIGANNVCIWGSKE